MTVLETKQLKEASDNAFAWVLSERLSLPPSSLVDFTNDASKVTSDSLVLDSSSLEARMLGHKIEHLLKFCMVM